jgi:hypothetical protein
MANTVLTKSAEEFGKLLGPHLEHDWYRCDKPHDRLMGKGCRTCGVEHYISIMDFRESGDLEVYDSALKPFLPERLKGKKT